MNKNKTNTKHKYLRSKGWKPFIEKPFNLTKKRWWIKGVYIENTKDAYKLQQKWDEEEQNQHKEVLWHIT